MSVTPQQREQHFESYAEDVADILRGIGNRWGGLEQIDNDEQDDEARKRYCLGYEYPASDQPGHVYGVFWYGGTLTIAEGRGGKAVHPQVPPTAYQCARIDIAFVADQMIDEFIIDGQHDVHSLGELKDRTNVMWNTDVWNLKSKHLEANAALYKQYLLQEQLFKANVKPIAATLKKMGEAWGGEEQTDNQPEPDGGKAGIGGLFGGGGGKKRFFVGFTAPQFQLNDKGKASLVKVAVWLDAWQGKKGTIQKGEAGRIVRLSEKPIERIIVMFPPGEPMMQIAGVPNAQAETGKAIGAMLVKLWKQNAFKIQGS